ncbi:MAG: hypothetical protein Q8R24_03765 [Legionellaceae bacterium]|nr:hypothetical protein [Legionellaceae bacterium]
MNSKDDFNDSSDEEINLITKESDSKQRARKKLVITIPSASNRRSGQTIGTNSLFSRDSSKSPTTNMTTYKDPGITTHLNSDDKKNENEPEEESCVDDNGGGYKSS